LAENRGGARVRMLGQRLADVLNGWFEEFFGDHKVHSIKLLYSLNRR